MGLEQDADGVACRMEKLEEYVDGLAIVPATSYYRTRMLLALISKALTSARAVCALVKAGFLGEAYAASRTLADIFFSVRYICNKDTESRAQTYFEYALKTQEEWTRLHNKYLPDRKALVVSFDSEEQAAVRKYRNRHEWTGIRGQAKAMALEEDSFEMDENGTPIKNEFDYDVIYWWTSQFVHGTVISMYGHTVEPGETYRIRPNIELEKDRGAEALFNVAVFVSKIFIYACRAIHEDQPDGLLRETLDFASSCARRAKGEAPGT